MKKFLLSSVAICALATPLAAQTDGAGGLFRNADPMEIRASEFIGMRVYASEAEVASDEYAGVDAGWNDIGEINDVVLSRDGKVAAVLVDIGGFLGMGEHTVAVDMNAIRLVSDAGTADDDNDFFVVMQSSRTDLETAPVYGMNADGTVATDTQASTDGTAAGTEGSADAGASTDTTATDGTVADGTVSNDAATDGSTANATNGIAREGYRDAEEDVLTADRLTGATVYDSTDENIGEISELQLTEDGKISAVIVDVGGFLGIGERPVALDMKRLTVLRNEAGDDVRVYVNLTKEEMEALPAYEK